MCRSLNSGVQKNNGQYRSHFTIGERTKHTAQDEEKAVCKSTLCSLLVFHNTEWCKSSSTALGHVSCNGWWFFLHVYEAISIWVMALTRVSMRDVICAFTMVALVWTVFIIVYNDTGLQIIHNMEVVLHCTATFSPLCIYMFMTHHLKQDVSEYISHSAC
jgi:hypothetical protein